MAAMAFDGRDGGRRAMLGRHEQVQDVQREIVELSLLGVGRWRRRGPMVDDRRLLHNGARNARVDRLADPPDADLFDGVFDDVHCASLSCSRVIETAGENAASSGAPEVTSGKQEK